MNNTYIHTPIRTRVRRFEANSPWLSLVHGLTLLAAECHPSKLTGPYVQDSGENTLTVQGTAPQLMEDSAHNEYSLDRFELADGECERKENKQLGLVAEVTMASCPRRQSNQMSCKILGPLVRSLFLSFPVCANCLLQIV